MIRYSLMGTTDKEANLAGKRAGKSDALSHLKPQEQRNSGTLANPLQKAYHQGYWKAYNHWRLS